MSNFNRKRLLIDMVRDAGLELISTDVRNGRMSAETRAPNGVTRTFTISNSSKIDPRGDLNEHARIKRFARENTPAVPAQPEEKVMSKQEATPAPITPAAQELTPGEFYKLCVWLKDVVLGENPESLEALASLASSHMGRVVSASTMREAMTATDTPEPDEWTKLPDPHVIFARELEQLMSSLGHDASPLFRRYLASI